MAANTSTRLPSTINSAKTALDAQAMTPVRKPRFVGAQLSKPDDVARQLNDVVDQLHKATQPARSNPTNSAITFEGLTFDSSLLDSQVKLQHNFGAKVRWSVVRWVQPPTGTVTTAAIYEPNAAPGQQGSQEDPSLLILRPVGGTLGVADVQVWIAS